MQTGEWKEWAQYVLNEIKENNDKIKAIYEQLKLQNETLIENHENWKEHMRRTQFAENNIALLLSRITEIERLEMEKKVVADYKKEVKATVYKAIGLIGTIIAAVYTIFKFYH